MQEKMLEMTELKEELAFTQSTVMKARKLENVTNEVGDKRGRSLDGWESDSNVQQLRAHVRLDLKIVQANSMHFRHFRLMLDPVIITRIFVVLQHVHMFVQLDNSGACLFS